MPLPCSFKRLCLVVMTTFCASSTFAIADEPPAIAPEIRRLLPEDFWDADPSLRIDLGGSAIGGAAAPSAFYVAAVEAIDRGGAGEKEFLAMSRHPYLCVRTVGLAGLAKIGSPAGIARLKELLASRESETGMPGGCLSSKISESLIAWEFLTNKCYLCCRRTAPLLGQNEALALTLEVLYRDDCAGVRESTGWRADEVSAPARFVMAQITSGRFVLQMDRLAAAAPSLKMHQLVKAAGRLPAQLATPFLIGVVHDEKATTECRLAAASALFRMQAYTHDFVERGTLLEVREKLDEIHPGKWGSALVKTDWDEWSKRYGTWKVVGKEHPEFFLPVMDTAIPPYCARALDPEEKWKDIPTIQSWAEIATAVRGHVRDFALWREDWNAFGDVLYRLELKARYLGEYGERAIEPEPARLAILEAVKEALAVAPAR